MWPTKNTLRRRVRCPKLASLLAGAVLANLQLVAAAQETGIYVMDRMSLATASGRMTSPSYESTTVVGQIGLAGTASSCEDNVSSFGFWSALGDLPVPIRLNIQRNAVDPGSVDLTWTGASIQFQTYRAFSPQDVLNPMNLYSEPFACAMTDGRAIDSDIIFYKVVPKL